jgi:hypothetical protein
VQTGLGALLLFLNLLLLSQRCIAHSSQRVQAAAVPWRKQRAACRCSTAAHTWQQHTCLRC